MSMDIDDELHRKRCKRWDTPRHAHYLTFSCFKRRAFLSRDRTCAWLADAIVVAREKHDFRIVAWVFMPEHAHLLIWPREKVYSIAKILASIKLPVTIRARGFVKNYAPAFLPQMLDVQPNGNRAVRFWQRGGGYDRNIFSGEELWEKIQYTHNNPVRRKLARRAVDWHWSSAADYARVRAGDAPLPVDNEYLPWTQRR